MPTLADYPELVAQLDRKNGPVAPERIAKSSKVRLWWRCPAGPDHRWSVPVVNRTQGASGCPFCANRSVSVTNALTRMAPAVARQWHPTRNGDLRARDVVAGSHRAVWWKCPKGPDHAWSAKIENRVSGAGCPFCSGRRPTAARNLAVALPDLAVSWHPTKNGALRPEDLSPRSSRAVWWKCPRGHEWSVAPSARARGAGCPFCSGRRVAPERSLAVIVPAIARQWHPTKNGDLTPRDVTMSVRRRVWWKCRKGPDHEWQATVAARAAAGNGCPCCAGQRVSVTNSLATRRPELALSWHPTKNGARRPEDVIAGSPRRAWWRCASGHAWQADVSSRSATGCGCPFCANKRVSATNSLAARAPELAHEWHPTRNGSLGPRDVVAGTPRRAWWRCASGHVWQASIHSRSGLGCGCPFCANHRVSATNSLSARFPKLAREWHPTKNGSLGPDEVTAGTHRRVWWRCAFGHEWECAVANRSVRGTGCGECWRLGHRQAVVTTGRKRKAAARFAAYEGARHGPVQRR